MYILYLRCEDDILVIACTVLPITTSIASKLLNSLNYVTVKITVDLENFGVKKIRKVQTSMKLKHTRFFTMTILLSNN